MMRILVLSDSHGNRYAVQEAIRAQATASVIFFLGDGEKDFEELREQYHWKTFVMVKGNCDFGSLLPENVTEIWEHKRIYATHGYLENVKWSEDTLLYRGMEKKADIVLYGHTHIPDNRYIEGMYVLNPGSLRQGNYAIIDITPAGILCNLVQLPYGKY